MVGCLRVCLLVAEAWLPERILGKRALLVWIIVWAFMPLYVLGFMGTDPSSEPSRSIRSSTRCWLLQHCGAALIACGILCQQLCRDRIVTLTGDPRVAVWSGQPSAAYNFIVPGHATS